MCFCLVIKKKGTSCLFFYRPNSSLVPEDHFSGKIEKSGHGEERDDHFSEKTLKSARGEERDDHFPENTEKKS